MTRLPPSARTHRLRPSSTGAPRWRISREGPCHASLHWQRPRRLPPAKPVGASPGRALAMSPHLGARTLSPIITYRRTQPVPLPVGGLPHLLTSAMPTPTSAVSYQRTWLVHILGGAPYISSIHPPTLAASGRLLRAYPRKKNLPYLPPSAHPRRLRPPLSDALPVYAAREGSCHASNVGAPTRPPVIYRRT